MPVHNLRYLLCKPGFAALLDGTNNPIFRVSDIAPVRLDGDSAASYVRFFFEFVDGPMGGFTIVEEPDDVVWLPNATDREKADVEAHLMPVTQKGIDSDGLVALTVTVLYQNVLFRTDIEVAPCGMDVVDRESGETVHFLPGEMRLENEELLLEELNVPTDPAPGEVG
jgi:hypothetical protein